MCDRTHDVAAVGNDVFVSTSTHCDAHRDDYDLLVHIHRNGHNIYGAEQTCNAVCVFAAGLYAAGPCTPGLYVTYIEGRSLDSLIVDKTHGFAAGGVDAIDALVEYAKKPGRLLVHCQMGCVQEPDAGLDLQDRSRLRSVPGRR